MGKWGRYIRFSVKIVPYIIVGIIIIFDGYCGMCIGICVNKYCGLPTESMRIECAKECGCPETYAYGLDPLLIVLGVILSVLIVVLWLIEWYRERQYRKNLEAFIRRELNNTETYSISDYIRAMIIAPALHEAVSKALYDTLYSLQLIQQITETATTASVIAIYPTPKPRQHISPFIYKILNKPSYKAIKQLSRHSWKRPYLFIPKPRYLNHKYPKPKVIVIHG